MKFEEEKQKEINTNNNHNLQHPQLELTITSTKTLATSEKILLTPNSINGVPKKLGEKFYFGRLMHSSSNKTNDYNFTDESIAGRQFEISFNKEKKISFLLLIIKEGQVCL